MYGKYESFVMHMLCVCYVVAYELLCILPFVILCLSAIRMMFVKILLAVFMFVGTAV